MVPAVAALVLLVIVAAAGTAYIRVRRRTPDAGDLAPRLPCRGSGGGLLILSERASAAFMLEIEGDATGVRGRIGGAVIARGQRGWLERAQRGRMPDRPAWPEPQGSSGGATVGGIWTRIDPQDRIAWIGTERVPLPEDHNVVLLDRADGVSGPPIVMGTLHVEPKFILPGPDCGVRGARHARARDDALKNALLHSPEVRAFVGL